MSGRILCLDQSGKCGFTHGVPGCDPRRPETLGNHGIPKSGVFRLTGSPQMSERFVKLEDFVRNMIRGNEIERVYFEEPIATDNSSFSSRVSLYGYVAVIGMACQREGIQCFPIAMQSWRSEFGAPTRAPSKIKDATVRRKWVKDATIARCRALGFDPKTDDEADSIGMWWAAAQRITAKEAAPTFDLLSNVSL